MAAATTEAEVAAFFATAQGLATLHMAEAMEFGLVQVIQEVRATSAYADDTGNLRNSTGFPGPIAASRERLPEIDRDADTTALIEATLRGITALLPIGMEYASHVDERVNFTAGPIEGSVEVFRSKILEATDALGRALEALQ